MSDLEDSTGAIPGCTIRLVRAPGWTVVVPRGELDLGSAPRLRGMILNELLADRGVLVELAGLDFVDLAGAWALADLVRQGRSRGGATVEVRGARGQVARLFELLDFEELPAYDRVGIAEKRPVTDYRQPRIGPALGR